jgi:hypothetical protein
LWVKGLEDWNDIPKSALGFGTGRILKRAAGMEFIGERASYGIFFKLHFVV